MSIAPKFVDYKYFLNPHQYLPADRQIDIYLCSRMKEVSGIGDESLITKNGVACVWPPCKEFIENL